MGLCGGGVQAKLLIILVAAVAMEGGATGGLPSASVALPKLEKGVPPRVIPHRTDHHTLHPFLMPHSGDVGEEGGDGHGRGGGGEGPSLIMVNYKLRRGLVEALWFNASVRVCADGAINRLYETFDDEATRARYIPEYIRGDLDSVQAHVSDYYVSRGTTIVKDTDQDTTDLEKCMELLRETNQLTRQVVVLGAFGGRLDHEFSHYNVLFKYPDIDLVLLSPRRSAFLLRSGNHKIDTEIMGASCGFNPTVKNITYNNYFRLIPLGKACEWVRTKGLKWDLDGNAMQMGGLISTSNIVQATTVEVACSEPLLWVCDWDFENLELAPDGPRKPQVSRESSTGSSD